MSITLTNRMLSGPLIVPLSTGASVRLSPGQTSSELPDVEVTANPALDKLVQRGLVEVQRSDDEEEPEGRPARSRGGRGRSKPDADGPDEGPDAPGDAPTSGDT